MQSPNLQNCYVSSLDISIALRVTIIYETFDLTVVLFGMGPLIHLTMVDLFGRLFTKKALFEFR